jgi:hypothetical protein
MSDDQPTRYLCPQCEALLTREQLELTDEGSSVLFCGACEQWSARGRAEGSDVSTQLNG